MRLIDADSLLANMEKGIQGTAREYLKFYQMAVNDEPTAYDVDKVVERLEVNPMFARAGDGLYVMLGDVVKIVTPGALDEGGGCMYNVANRLANSGQISNFLSFLRTVQSGYDIAASKEEDANKETQDILHRLELYNDSGQDMARMAEALKRVRKERREAKDTKAMAEPVLRWLRQNEKVAKGLEQLLGEVRKAEKGTENRHYIEKTTVLSGILREGNKDGE